MQMRVVSLQLFLVTLFCLDGTSAYFTETPRNTVIQESLEVSLSCQAVADRSSHDIEWWVARIPGGTYRIIGLNDVVYREFRTRYVLAYEVRSSRSVLTITGVLPEDAGTFRCHDKLDAVNAYSQLILVGGEPQVEGNATMDDMVEGESFALSCHVGYIASINWRPMMTWREATEGVLHSRDESNKNEARYVYATETTRDHNGKWYQCSAEFGAIPEGDIPESIRDQHDMAPPDYSFLSPMTDLTVNFPIENLQLVDPKDVYSPGESLMITAQGRPGPSFSWQNIITNDTVAGNVLPITQEMEGTQNWAYTAYNVIRGEVFEMRGSHHFTVEVFMTTATSTYASSTVSMTTTPGIPASSTDSGGVLETLHNTVAYSHLEVQLTCEGQGTALDIMWRVATKPGDPFRNIGLNGNVYAPFIGRYSLAYQGTTPRATTKSILIITSVLFEDAGMIHCQVMNHNLDSYAQLIVLEGEPEVEQNATTNEMVEGESFALSCFVSYMSSSNWAPAMTWKEKTLGDLPAINLSTATEARYVYTSSTDRLHNGREFQCFTRFPSIPKESIPEGIRDDHDMSSPDFNIFSSIVELTVLFPVENLQLLDPKDVYAPGENLVTVAEGRPEPTYEWQNRNRNNNTVVYGNVLYITEEMKGVQNWTYMATNVIRGQVFQIKHFFNFIVEN